MPIRVLIADDHALMREGLIWILRQQPEIDVVGEAECGDACLRMLKQTPVDIVLMDILMPGSGGIDATRRITSVHPGVKVLALSSQGDRRYVLAAFQAGAVGYVLKDAAGDELAEAIRRVQAGERYLGSGITGLVIDAFLRGDNGDSLLPLSDRECEVLQRLAEGRTSIQIAGELHLAPSTVETHRRNIMRKLDLHSVADLTRFAIRHGLTSA